MKLLEKYLESEKETFIKNDIKFQAIGDRSQFSKKLQTKIAELEKHTAHCQSLVHSLALNYGARDEIVRSAQKIIDAGGTLSEEALSKNLDHPVDIDLLIRTGGDHRISNFLLWQASYAELFFTETLWPDFNKEELHSIVHAFKSIDRRFGGTK